MNTDQMIKKLEAIRDLPTLPVVAMELNRLLQDEEAGVAEVKAIIEKDQAIVPRLLKLVNSAFFGLNAKVTKLSHAIMVLGFTTVRSAVLSISVIDAFKGAGKSAGFDPCTFWSHSIAVAVTARHLAASTRCSAPEDAFTAGLLHDIGKIVLYQYFPVLFQQVLDRMETEGLRFADAENGCLPLDHAYIGRYLCTKWKLPDQLTDTIRWHHHFRENVADAPLLMIITAADTIVGAMGDEGAAAVLLQGLPRQIVEAMAPLFKTAPQWMPQVREDIQAACAFFMGGA